MGESVFAVAVGDFCLIIFLKNRMEFLENLKDSVETSVNLGVFKNRAAASEAHIYKSSYTKIPMTLCKKLKNFNPDRLSSNPYPEKNRPRGSADLDSVKYHRDQIRRYGQTTPIYLGSDNTLFDGAHRIVAYYLENKRQVPAYIIETH